MKVDDRRLPPKIEIKTVEPGEWVELPYNILQEDGLSVMVLSRDSALAEEDREKFHLNDVPITTLKGSIWWVSDVQKVRVLDTVIMLNYKQPTKKPGKK